MLFHYLIEGMCHRNKYTICTVFVCTHAAGRGRDKGLSFLTHCLVTLSGYDRACTCLSSSSRSPTLVLFFFFFFNLVNYSPCSGRGRVVAHVRTKRARGDWLHISINSSGLASLKAGGGLGTVISPMITVSWQSEWREREKRIGDRPWVSSCLNKRMLWWRYLDVTKQGDGSAPCVNSPL